MENLKIIDNSQTDYVLIYSEKEDENSAVRKATEEFIYYIFKSTGVKIECKTDSEVLLEGTSKYISFGKTKLLEDSNIDFNYSLLKHDGFFIKSINNSLFIDGVSERGVLYGTYEFLERFLGIKFLTFEETYIPKVNNLIIPNVDLCINPDFNLRCFSSEPTMHDYSFLAHTRTINEYLNIPREFGGNLGQFWVKEELEHAVHNSLYYVEPSKYQQEHSEWFFVNDENSAYDLCYSNAGLNEDGSIDDSKVISPVKIVIEKLKHFIKISDKSTKYFFFGQMDAGYNNHCHCDKCRAQEEKYGTSGMLIRFLNAVDGEIQKWIKEENINREIYLCTFAYQWSEMPPVKKVDDKFIPLDKSVIPHDSVVVRVCTIRANQYYSIVDPKQLSQTRDMLNGWRVILKDKKSMIWSYHSRFTYPFCFYPTMQHWVDDFKVYREIGCEYVYMQPNHFELNDWKAMMETYVASKFLWNSSLNPFELRNEYIKYYYSFIGPLVSKFINNYEKHFEDLMNSNSCPNMALQGLGEILDAKYYSENFWKEQFDLINQMYELIKLSNLSPAEKEKMFIKVDRIKLTIESTVLYRYKDYHFKNNWILSFDEMREDFFRACDKLHVQKTGEWQTLEDLKKVL